jgi:hypothetical protein
MGRAFFMNLHQFKEELRILCEGTLDKAIDAWFECVGRLYLRHETIPSEWRCEPEKFGCDDKSLFYPLFKKTKTRHLRTIATFLHRYLRYAHDVDHSH